MVKDLPHNAGDLGSVLGWGVKVLQAREQLSLRAVTAEQMATTREPVSRNKRCQCAAAKT